MKFSFASSNTINDDESHVFHPNLFRAKSSSLSDDDDNDDDYGDDEYTTEEKEYTSCNQTKHFEINDLSLPLTGLKF